MTDRRPLDGVRICDFTWVWAGPSGTELLSELGAELIKVESRARPDTTRFMSSIYRGIPPKGINESNHFWSLNLGKRDVTVNLMDPRGTELIKRVIGKCDLVCHNFAGGALERMGLDYSILKEVKPDIILISLAGFGETGPWRLFRGYAEIFTAVTGMTDMTGYPDGPPGRAGALGHCDFTAGIHLALTAIAALEHRARTGEGQMVDLSQTEALACTLGDLYFHWIMNKDKVSRVGNKDDWWAPHDCYRCQGEDQWVAIAVCSNQEWQAFCRAIGKPAWITDSRFADALGRKQNEQELDRLITEWTSSHTKFEVVELLQKAGVAAFPSMLQEDLYNDPHLKERGFLEEVKGPGERGEVFGGVFEGPPWRFSDTPAKLAPAPVLGQDNAYVFKRLLGMSHREYSTLIGQNVIF
jgi:benzylsuccinate CoA-transferase BbsF subunit